MSDTAVLPSTTQSVDASNTAELTAALLRDPQNSSTFQAALAAATSGQTLEGLVKQLEEAATVRGAAAGAVNLWLYAAQVWDERLSRPDRAESALLKALALEPTSLDVMRALSFLLEKGGRLAELAVLLERMASASHDNVGKAVLLERLGRLQDGKLGLPDKALMSLQAAFRADRNRLSALRYARGVHVRTGREDLAKQLLDLEAEAMANAADAAEALPRIADEYVDLAQALVPRPAQHKVALDAINRALKLVPEHARAKAASKALEEFATHWQEHIRHLRDEALDARDKRVAASRYLAIAQIYRDYGNDSDRALEYLDKCLLLTPGHRPALKFLEQLYKEQNRVPQLMTRLKELAQDAKDPQVAIEIHLMSAVILAEMQAPKPTLGEAYAAVLKLDPSHKSALNALLEIYLEDRQYSSAVAALDAYANATRTGAERRWALFTMARLLEVELGDLNGAVARYELILENDPRDKEALEHLERVYARAGRHQDYVRVLEALRLLTSSEQEKLRCLDQLARTYSADLKMPELAFESLRQAFALDPRPAREAELMRLAEQINRVGDLGEAFMRAASRLGPGAEQNSMMVKAARMFAAGRDNKRAREALDPVLASDPTNRAALDVLEGLSAKGADARELVVALRARLAATAAPTDRRTLLVRIARLFAEELKETQEAVQAWREVLALDKDDREALAALDELLKREERWTDLASVLRARLQREPDSPEAPALKLRLARVCEERLDRPDEAADLYLTLHEKEPDRPEVLAALERLLARGVNAVRIATVLEPHYARVGAWRRHAEMLDIRRQGSRDPAERLALARQTARVLAEELRSPKEAFRTLATALQDAPADAELARELEKLAHQAKAFGELCEVFAQASQLLPEGPARVALLSRRAFVLAEQLGDEGEALAAHKALVAGHPKLLSSWEALCKLHMKRGEWAPAADALQVAADLTDGDQKANHLRTLGDICLDELKDHARAAAAYEPLRTSVDEKLRDHALDALDAAYTQLQDAASLASVLHDRATVAQGPARAEFRARLGELLAGPLQQPARAIEALEQSLGAELTNARARAVLETLLNNAPDANVRKAAARLLEPVYRSGADPRGVARVLKGRMESAQSPEERREHVVALAGVYARDLRQPDEALELLSQHLQRDPADENARRELEAVARLAAKPERIVDAYRAVVLAHPGAVAIEYGRKLGALCERGGDREGALAAYQAVLASAPHDAEALQAVVRLRRLGQDPRALAEALELLAESQQGEARAASLREAANLWSRVNDVARALDALARAREANIEDITALRMTAELLELADEAGPLASALEELARRVQEPERGQLLVKLGRLRRERLEDPLGAITALSQVLEGKPTDMALAEAVAILEGMARAPGNDAPTAVTTLANHYKQSRAPAPLAALLEHRAGMTPTGAERARLLDEVSRIYEEELAQKEQAFMASCRALREEPTEERRTRAERLAGLTRAYDAYAGVLEDVAEGLVARDPMAAAQRWREIARVAVEKLQDRALAIRSHNEILKLVPGDPSSLAALESFHREGAETDALVEVLKAKAGAATTPQERREALLQAARLLQDDRGDLPGAEGIYRQLLAEFPQDDDVLELLDALYVRAGNTAALAAVLPMRIQKEQRPKQRAFLGARLGRLLMEQPGGAVAAFQVLTKAAEDDTTSADVTNALTLLLDAARQTNTPPARDVARVMERCLRARNDVANLPAVLDAQLVGEPDANRRAQVLFELARVQEELARQPTLAFMSICRAVREAPGDDAIRERAERLAQATDSLEELAAVYEDVLTQARDGRLQALLSRRVAAISETRLRDPEAAIRHLRNALVANPDDVQTLEHMARLLRERGPSPDLLEVLKKLSRHSAAADDLVRTKAIFHEVAQVAEQMGDVSGAISALNDVLLLDAADRNALRGLDRLLTRAERYHDLAGVLQAQIALAQSPGEASDLRIRLAGLKMTALGDSIGAAEVLAQAAADAPGNPRVLPALESVYSDLSLRTGPDAAAARTAVAALLEPRYEALGDAHKLVSVLESRLESTDDKRERKALHRRIAGLREGPLRSPELAFAALGRALKETADDDSLRADVERLAQVTGDIDMLVGLYLDVLEEERTGPLALVYRRRVATLLETGLQDPARAVEHYRLALDHLGPAEGDTQDARDVRMDLMACLERLHRSLGQSAALADVLRRRAALEQDARVVRQLLMEVSRLQSDQQDVGSAIGTLRRLMELNPNDLEVLRQLQTACERQERWQDLVELLMREAELCAASMPDRELDARYRAASILDTELDRANDALSVLSQILVRRPEHQVTRAYLEDRLRSRPSHREATAEVLKRAYLGTEDWKRAIDVLEQLVSDAEVAGNRERERSLLMEIAQLYLERLSLTGPAFGALCRALKVDRTDKSLQEYLLEVARAQGTVEELAEIYEDEASSAELEGRTPVAAELREAAAKLHETDLAAPDRAIELYELVLQKNPGRLVPLEALQRLYERAERWSDVEVTVRKRLAVADGPEERAPLLHVLGATLGLHLGAVEEGIESLEEAFALDNTRADTRACLITLYEQVKQWDKMFALLQQELQYRLFVDDKVTALEVRRRLVKLLTGTMNRPQEALDHVKVLRAAFPADKTIFQDLETLLSQLGMWHELRALYDEELARDTDPARTADLSSRLARVLSDHLSDDTAAIQKYTRILELNPRDMGALDALRKIYKKSQKWEDLVGILRRMRRLQTDSAGIKAVQFDLAEVLGAQGKRADAIEAGRRVLDIEPHSDEDLIRLYEIFHANEAFEECAGVLERRVGIAATPEMRVDLLFQLAELWEGPLGRRERASSAYERILQAYPAHLRAYEALAAVYEHAEEWRKLVTLKEARMGHADSADEKIRLLREIGALYEQKLNEKALAFLAACRAFRENPMDRELGVMVERLAVDTDSAEELVGVLEDTVSRVDDTPRAIELYLKMAEFCAEHLSQPQEAENHLNLIFDLDAQNQGALNALEKLYQGQDRWADVVRVLERKLALAEDEDGRRSILLKMAGVQEERLFNPADAINTYKRLLEIDGRDSRAIQALTRLYQQTGRWQALIGILARAMELSFDVGERVALRYRIGGIQEAELQDPEAAIITYKAVLEEDPSHNLSLKALERLYTQLEHYPELLQVYETQIQLSADPDEQIRLLSKVATIHEEHFVNLQAAIQQTERILHVDARNLVAIKNLERLFKETGEHARLISALQRHAELVSDPDERLNLFLQMGELYWKELNRTDKAEEVYLQALSFDAHSIKAIHALGQLYERSGNWFNALEKLSQEAELLKGGPDAVELHYRMGTINADMLMDTPAARTCYENALKLDPGHLPSLQALKAIHYANKEYDLYLRRLVEEAEFTNDNDQKTELFTAAGLFVQDRAGDLDGAVRYYERALAITPDHLGAAKPLADIEFRKERFEKAEDLLEIVVRKLDPAKDAKELCKQFYRLGYITEKLGKDQKALKNYQRAYEIDSTYLPALEGLGAALMRTERWDDAQKIYQTILIHHRESLTDAEVVDYYFKLGDISDRVGQAERAVRNLEKALELDANHIPSLQLLAAVQEKAGKNEEAYEALHRLAPLLSGDDKVALLIQTGTLSQHKLNDPYRSIDAFEEANRLRRDDKEILTALLALYRETKQGPKAVEALEDLVRIEPDETTRVRLNHQLGEVYRDEIRNDARAVQYFNAALDLDASFVKSFEAVERLLTERKMWRALEENYRAMIARTPKDQVRIRAVLWKNLAELYHKVLKEPDNAINAYKVLSALEPENIERVETMADLMARRPGREDEAIQAYNEVLPKAASPANALHALARLYLARRLPDRTWCTVQALRILKEVTEEEANIHNLYTPQLPQRHGRAMTEKLWEALLVHERALGPVAHVSGLLWRAAAPLLVKDVKEHGLAKKKEFAKVDVEHELTFTIKQLAGVQAVFGNAPFDMWALKGGDALPTLLPAFPTTMVVGNQSLLFKEHPPKVLWAMWGRFLSFMRPQFMLPRVLGPDRFRLALEAALFIMDTSARYANDPKELEKLARALIRVEGLEAGLKQVKGQFNRKEAPNVDMFYEGMEHTAVRASLVACNDVDITLQVMKVPDPQSPPQPKNRVRELVLFLVSEQYAELRTRLGLALKS
ncbi:MAG: tetratricopeptide repeat protein [Myxococcota bacterium]